MLNRLACAALGAATTLGFMTVAGERATAYDNYVVNNLQRSRDALLSQRSELQQAYDQTSRQIDSLQQKLTRIDGYLRQIEQSLRDVNRALDEAQR